MKLKYFVIDVDGTMTDGGIYYDSARNEIKKFSVRDAAGIFAAQQSNIKIIVLTGRKCEATTRRMQDLKIDIFYQNIKNKANFLKKFMEQYNIKKEEIAYIGDDLNDLPAMMLTGFIGCPSDSCREVIKIADYVSNVCGGQGAVRDIIEWYMRNEGIWENAVSKVYGIGV